MVRFNFFIDEAMLEHLEVLPGTVTEHIRQALYDYLLKLQTHNASASQSTRKEGHE